MSPRHYIILLLVGLNEELEWFGSFPKWKSFPLPSPCSDHSLTRAYSSHTLIFTAPAPAAPPHEPRLRVWFLEVKPLGMDTVYKRSSEAGAYHTSSVNKNRVKKRKMTITYFTRSATTPCNYFKLYGWFLSLMHAFSAQRAHRIPSAWKCDVNPMSILFYLHGVQQG